MKVLTSLLVFIFCYGSVAEAYQIFQENGKTGLKDDQGKIIIPAQYEALGWSNAPFSVINNITGYKSNGLWGLINLNNRVVAKPIYATLSPTESNLVVASRKMTSANRLLTGCLDVSGKERIPFHYDGIKVNSLQAIVFLKTGEQYKYGVVDLDDKTIIPAQYQNIIWLGNLRYGVCDFQNRCALFSEGGKQITGFLFESISPYKKNYAVIVQDHSQGIIDRDGVVVVQPKYAALTVGEDGTVRARSHNSWYVLDGQNKTLQTVVADSIYSLNNNFFCLCSNGQFSLVNAQFMPIVPARFSYISPFADNKAIVKQGDKYGLISSSGSFLVECKYQDLVVDNQYVLAEVSKDQWVLLDSAGERKTPRTYSSIARFNGIYFAVKNKSYYGAINADGKEVIAAVYDSIVQYLEGRLVVKFRGAYGIIDMKENWIVAPQPYPQRLISADRYFLKKEGTTFLKSFDGNIIYFTSNSLEAESDHLIESVSTGGTWKLDLDGRIVSRQLPPTGPYERIFPESEGLRGIRKDGRYGFVDDRGRLRIANRYEDIQPFQERLAAVRILGKWGFIDHDEKLVIQPVHEATTSFSNGIAIVKQKGQYGLINTKGTVVLPLRYHTITALPTKRFIVENDGIEGLADTDGRLIIVPKFHKINDLNNGYFVVERDGQYGLITTKGISTVPLMYDYLGYDTFNARYLALRKAVWEKIL